MRLSGKDSLQPLLPALPEPPEAEQSLEQIVGDDEALDVVRVTILHKPEIDKFYPDKYYGC